MRRFTSSPEHTWPPSSPVISTFRTRTPVSCDTVIEACSSTDARYRFTTSRAGPSARTKLSASHMARSHTASTVGRSCET